MPKGNPAFTPEFIQNLKEGIPQKFPCWMDIKMKEKLDLMIKRLEKADSWLAIDGDEGCLTGDTIIKVSRFKACRSYTLKKLYTLFHVDNKRFDLKETCKVRSFNGEEIRLHKIKDVLYSGKKKVYCLRLENGLSIKATADHKFLARDGWIELKDLKPEQEIMCDNLYPMKSHRKRIKLYDVQLPVGKNHPYSSNTGRVEVHRLIYESYINNLSFTEYLDILLNEPEQCKHLKFVNPELYEIHHEDGCHYNNTISNLKLMSVTEHKINHGAYENFSQGIPKFSKVLSTEPAGEEDTYDIQCEEPHHNFVANGMVVHNSGKTNMAAYIMLYVACQTGRPLTLDHFYFDSTGLVEYAKKNSNGLLNWDEAALGGLSTEWAKKSQVNLLKLAMTGRIKHHFIVLCIPKIRKLTEYIALDRCLGLVHTYERKGIQKGRYCYYKKAMKEGLYNDWKRSKIMKYKKFTTFRGSFPEVFPYILDEDAYNKKKEDAIACIGDPDKKLTQSDQRFLKIKYKIATEPGALPKDICKRFEIPQQTLSDWKRIPEKYPQIFAQ